MDARRRAASASEKPVESIHVDDIAGALVALADRDVRSTTYNVVDDDPAPRSAVSAFADELGRPGAREGRGGPRGATGSKRCRNASYGSVYELLAPTYREGLLRIKDADPAVAAAARRQDACAAIGGRADTFCPGHESLCKPNCWGAYKPPANQGDDRASGCKTRKPNGKQKTDALREQSSTDLERLAFCPGEPRGPNYESGARRKRPC